MRIITSGVLSALLILSTPSPAQAMVLRRSSATSSSSSSARPSIDALRAASIRRAHVRLPTKKISRRTRQRDVLRQQQVRIGASRSSAANSSSMSQTRTETPMFDPRTDAAVRSDIVLLGTVTPILAGVKAFSTLEPMDVTEVEIAMTSDASSISQFIVYDHSGRVLGNATRSDGNFIARLPSNTLQLPHKQEVSLYVRARLKPESIGGVSGEDIQVDSITVRGTGEWSNADRATTSSETFVAFETARARLISVVNAGATDGILVDGTNQILGAFRFSAEESDSAAEARLTSLAFTVESFGGVTISDPLLRVQGIPDAFNCSLVGSTIACTNITASFGTINTTPFTLRVYADVTVPASSNDMFVRLTLNNAGTPSSAGDIQWTDGFANFNWVPFDAPVVRGTGNTR